MDKTSGLTLSLETQSSGVWLNASATAMHKFVISFCIGVECISNQVDITIVGGSFLSFAFQASLTTYTISTVVFSFASALGSLLGMVWT